MYIAQLKFKSFEVGADNSFAAKTLCQGHAFYYPQLTTNCYLLTTRPTERLKTSPGTNLTRRAAMPSPVSSTSVTAVHVHGAPQCARAQGRWWWRTSPDAYLQCRHKWGKNGAASLCSALNGFAPIAGPQGRGMGIQSLQWTPKCMTSAVPQLCASSMNLTCLVLFCFWSTKVYRCCQLLGWLQCHRFMLWI